MLVERQGAPNADASVAGVAVAVLDKLAEVGARLTNVDAEEVAAHIVNGLRTTLAASYGVERLVAVEVDALDQTLARLTAPPECQVGSSRSVERRPHFHAIERDITDIHDLDR